MHFRRSSHQVRVDNFMLLAKQELPLMPTQPSPEIRSLRAKLIFEEAMETIAALGVKVVFSAEGFGVFELPLADVGFDPTGEFDLVEVIDGCCDIKVVTTGTLSACGIPDIAFQCEVDTNNLAKFGPGHTIRADGKLIKPPGHQPPQIAEALEALVAYRSRKAH